MSDHFRYGHMGISGTGPRKLYGVANEAPPLYSGQPTPPLPSTGAAVMRVTPAPVVCPNVRSRIWGNGYS